MDSFLIYLIHWVFVCSVCLFSWNKYKKIHHPHFIFTFFLVIFLSDFLIRGYEDENIENIFRSNLYYYQSIILFILGTIVYLTSKIQNVKIEKILSAPLNVSIQLSKRLKNAIFLIGTFTLLIDLYKRFSSVNWSISNVISESLISRGQAIWDQSANTEGNFIFSLSTSLLPYAGVAFASLVYSHNDRVKLKILPLFLYVLVLLLLVLNGSRTPVVMSLFSLGFLVSIQQKALVFKKLLTIMLSLIIAFTISSVMVTNRSEGYEDISSSSTDTNFIYHQDDSYYRAISSYEMAKNSNERWDPVEFFTIIAVNFIPRAYWSNKPLFTQDFYGSYKLEYVTTLFLGETVAMFGVGLSILLAPIIGCLIYFLLYNSARVLSYPFGIVSYLLIALYCYMCLRSLPNLMFFIYLPGFSFIVSYFLNKHLK